MPLDDVALGALAADLYHDLPPERQTEIAPALAERPGPGWYGDPNQPANDTDQPAYRTQLTALPATDGTLSDVAGASRHPRSIG